MAKPADCLKVGAVVLSLGMEHDTVIEILKDKRVTGQLVVKDAGGAMTIFRRYNMGASNFILGFGRIADPGPYCITSIGILGLVQ